MTSILRFVLSCLFLCTSSTLLWAQENENFVAVIFLGNEQIAEVNLEQNPFIRAFAATVDYVKDRKHIAANQKVAIHLNFHPSGKPDMEFYGSPTLEKSFLDQLKKDFLAMTWGHTNIVDMPLLITVNASNDSDYSDFPEFKPLGQRQADAYRAADLKTKYELNRNYAKHEVLPILAAFESKVDDQFEGVKNLGKLIQKTNWNQAVDIQKLCNQNKNYWRATMEMNVGNQIIPITKIFALAADGELDYAYKLTEIMLFFADQKSVSHSYLKEFKSRMDIFNQQLSEQISVGITHHDAGEYKQAIALYDQLLSEYPNSAWLHYEKFYSTAAMKVDTNKLEDRRLWDASKKDIYKHNPLYGMDVRASNGREAYLLYRRMSIADLFKKEEESLQDIYSYADIALDLGVYDFAAQLFWSLTTAYQEKSEQCLHRYLYCLEKLGVPELKENFKGDFKKIFKSLEEEKKKVMEEDSVYKAMKN